MIGEDDWCVNYDKDSRMCKIYETRPEFCVVDPRKFKLMYKVEKEDFNVRRCRFCTFKKNSDHSGYEKEDFIFSFSCLRKSNHFFQQDFCKFCCAEQIADVYGEDSEEMIRFEDVIDGLETEVAM